MKKTTTNLNQFLSQIKRPSSEKDQVILNDYLKAAEDDNVSLAFFLDEVFF